jgi:hypothetical protein
MSTHGRPVLGEASVNRLVEVCGETGVGEVTVWSDGVGGDGVGVVCRSSWALNRIRRWTTGPEPAAEPARFRGLYGTRRLAADELGLREGPLDTSLAW